MSDGFIPSPRWEEITKKDPPPVNPFKDRWEIPSKGCVVKGYGCVFCGKCPFGDYWKVPEEDETDPEYQKFMKATEEWEKRNPDWEDALMECMLKLSPEKDGDANDKT